MLSQLRRAKVARLTILALVLVCSALMLIPSNAAFGQYNYPYYSYYGYRPSYNYYYPHGGYYGGWWDYSPYYNRSLWYDRSNWFDGYNYAYDRYDYDSFWDGGLF